MAGVQGHRSKGHRKGKKAKHGKPSNCVSRSLAGRTGELEICVLKATVLCVARISLEIPHVVFERPEAGGKAVLLQVELRRQKNPDQNTLLSFARSAQIDVVHVEGVKRDAPHRDGSSEAGKLMN